MNHLNIPLRQSIRVLALSALLFPSFVLADIPVWRGNHNGTYDVQSAPTNWQSERVFEIPLDTKSNGTPILADGKLYFTAEPDQLICADATSGKIIWQKSNDLFTLHGITGSKKAELEAY